MVGMSTGAITPEQRRQKAVTRRPLFTVALAGPDVQRKFLFRTRMLFALASTLALGAMWLGAVWPIGDISLPLVGGLGRGIGSPTAGLAVFLLLASLFARERHKVLQVLLFGAAIVLLGLAIGLALPGGSRAIQASASVIVAVPLWGYALNTRFLKAPSAFREYLLTGPWFLAGLLLGTFVQASQWVLAVSGSLSLCLLFALHRAAPLALPIYQPNESLVAAADVLPLAVIPAFLRLVRKL